MPPSDAELIARSETVQRLRTREMQSSQRVAARIGDQEAEAAHQQLFEALRDASDALAELSATTSAGLTAKASAMVSIIDQAELAAADALLEHEKLVLSILRDAAKLEERTLRKPPCDSRPSQERKTLICLDLNGVTSP